MRPAEPRRRGGRARGGSALPPAGPLLNQLSGRDREQVEEVLALAREVLGPDLVGAYLHGSAALGRLRPDSDLDVLVVSNRATSIAEKRRLAERLLRISGRGSPVPARPLEVTIVVQSELRPWRYPPRFDFQYGDWLRAEFERGEVEPAPSPNPDVATLIAMVLLANRPLAGPPPGEVLDPVPRDDLARAMVAGIPDLLADLDSDTRNVLLTLARIWTSAATGEIRPKDEAAAWALGRLAEEHRPVLARARAAYLSGEDERWDDLGPRVRACADVIVAEIERV